MNHITKQKWVAQLLLLLMVITKPVMADVNILVIGSDSDSSLASTISFEPARRLTAPFDPAGVIAELTNILEGAGETNVHIAFEDFSSPSNEVFPHTNLFSWFHYPFSGGVENRASNLRGELGTEWDYVVLIGDAHSIEHMPGFYALGVSEIAKEVAEGTAETVLLMPWPSEFGIFNVISDSTVDHYKEVVYRVGRTGGCLVAPAGLAWEASGEAGDSVNLSHPTDNGAYIAAATLYSRIYGKNAATNSTYTPNDTLATVAFNTVEANKGAVQYTGRFETEHPHKAQFNTNRNINYSITGTSTERTHIDNLQDVLDACRVKHSSHFSHRYNSDDPIAEGSGWPTDEDGNPLGPIDYNFGKFDFSVYDEFNVNPDFWKRGYVFRYQNLLTTLTAPLRISFHDHNAAVKAYAREPYAGALIPLSSWAMLHRLRPNVQLNAAGNHLTDLALLPNTSFMNTIDSGRCPLTPEVETPSDAWVAMKVGYEAAWIMGNLQLRAPGFRVLPSSADKQEINNYEAAGAEQMSVQFIFEPREEVTVQLTSSNPSLITITPSSLTFTPGNHDVAQNYTVSIRDGAATTDEEITVNVTTISEDEAYNELIDSWVYTAKARDVASLPIAVRDEYRVGVNTNLTTSADTGVIANDITNPQSAISQISLISNVSNGTLNLNNDGSFLYSPHTDFDGLDTFSYRLSNTNGSSEEVTVNIAVSDLDPSLLVWYDFEEMDGTTVKDLTAYGRDGTINNTIRQVAGVAENTMGADLTSGTIDIPIDQEYRDLLDRDEISIAFWGYLNPLAASNNNSNSVLLTGRKTYGPDTYKSMEVRIQTRTASNTVQLWWDLGIYTQGAANDATGIPNNPAQYRLRVREEDTRITAAEIAGQWVHWTFMKRSGGSFAIYMNGRLVDETGLAGLLAIARVDEIDDLVMGSGFNGNVDDFRIYNRAISVADINGLINPAVEETVIARAGSGGGYDVGSAEASAFRSTNTAKSFDTGAAIDNVYGSLGYWFFGDGTSNSSNHSDGLANWVTASPATNTSTLASNQYARFDNPTQQTAGNVSDWTTTALGFVDTVGTNGGIWAELLTFTVDESAPREFRVGIMAGNDNSANGSLAPAALRLSFDGSNVVEVSDLAASSLGMVFYNITLPDGASGTFLIEGQTRSLGADTRGPSIAGITFDEASPAVADDLAFTGNEDEDLAITLTGSVGDGDSLTYEVVNAPLHGTLVGDTDQLTYIPNPDYNGADSFTYRTNDGISNSAEATVSITLTPTYDAVRFNSDFIAQSVSAGFPLYRSLEDLVVNVDGGPLVYSVDSGPRWLSFSNGALGGFPTTSNFGVNTFTLRISDVENASDTLTVELTVNDSMIGVSGIGSGYTVDTAEASAYRSTGVDKTYDLDGDNVYGTAGHFFYGRGATNTDSNTDRSPSWVNIVVPSGISLVGASAYHDYDDPTRDIANAVNDWTVTTIALVNTSGTTGGLWADLLAFTIDETAPRSFRLGVMAANEGAPDGRWDPAALRLSFEGGTPTVVSGLPVTDLGMVFFDVTIPSGATGTFLIEGQNRDLSVNTRGPSITGITFDESVTLQRWAASYPTLNDTSFDSDPDNDGIANGLEYILAGNPTENDTFILPQINTDSDSFTFTFNRLASSALDTNQVLQYSTTLEPNDWTDINITGTQASEVVIGPEVEGIQEVNVTIPMDETGGEKLFVRLWAELVE